MGRQLCIVSVSIFASGVAANFQVKGPILVTSATAGALIKMPWFHIPKRMGRLQKR